MDINESREFFRQLGLPRHEIYEWAKRSLEMPSFNLKFFRNRRHELRSQRIAQEKVDSTIVEEIKDLYHKFIKAGRGRRSRNRDRSVSVKRERSLRRSERSRSINSGRNWNRQPSRTPPPPIISNLMDYISHNDARVRSRSPVLPAGDFNRTEELYAGTDSIPFQENFGQRNQNRNISCSESDTSHLKTSDSASGRWNERGDGNQQLDMRRLGKRCFNEHERSEMRLLYGNRDNWEEVPSGSQQSRRSRETYQQSGRPRIDPQKDRYLNEVEQSDINWDEAPSGSQQSRRSRETYQQSVRPRIDPQKDRYLNEVEQSDINWDEAPSGSRQSRRTLETYPQSGRPRIDPRKDRYFNDVEQSDISLVQSCRTQWNEDRGRDQKSNVSGFGHRNNDQVSRELNERGRSENRQSYKSRYGNEGYQDPNGRRQSGMTHFQDNREQNDSNMFVLRGKIDQKFSEREQLRMMRFHVDQEQLGESKQPDRTNFCNQGYKYLNEGVQSDVMILQRNRYQSVQVQECNQKSTNLNDQDMSGSVRFQNIREQWDGNRGGNHQRNMTSKTYEVLNKGDQSAVKGFIETQNNWNGGESRNQPIYTNIPRLDPQKVNRLEMTGFQGNQAQNYAVQGSTMTSFVNQRNQQTNELGRLGGQIKIFHSGKLKWEPSNEGLGNSPSTSKPPANNEASTFFYRTAKEQRRYRRALFRKSESYKKRVEKKKTTKRRSVQLSSETTTVLFNRESNVSKKIFHACPEDLSHISKRFRLRKMKNREFWESWWRTNGMVEEKALKVSDYDPDLLSVINVLTNSSERKMNTKYLHDCEKALMNSLNNSSLVGRSVNAYDFLKAFVITSAVTPPQVSRLLTKAGRRVYNNIDRVTRSVDIWYYCVALIGMWRQAYQATFIPGPNREAAIELTQRDKVFNWLTHLSFDHIKLISKPIMSPLPMEQQLHELYETLLHTKLKSKHAKFFFVRAQIVQDLNNTLLKTLGETESLFDNMPNPLKFKNVLLFSRARIFLSDTAWNDKINDRLLLKRKDDLLAKFDNDANVAIFEKYLLDTLLCVRARLNYVNSVHKRLRINGFGINCISRFLARSELNYICKRILEKRIKKYDNFEGVGSHKNPEGYRLVVANENNSEDCIDLNLDDESDFENDDNEDNDQKYNERYYVECDDDEDYGFVG